jgi:YVTN family beta-propeller protein
VRLPGDTSRWDYQVFDATSHRLYIAHLGANHGLVLAGDLGRLYASATGGNQVAVIDTSRLAVIGTVPTGDYPDGLAYVAEAGKVYVSKSCPRRCLTAGGLDIDPTC